MNLFVNKCTIPSNLRIIDRVYHFKYQIHCWHLEPFSLLSFRMSDLQEVATLVVREKHKNKLLLSVATFMANLNWLANCLINLANKTTAAKKLSKVANFLLPLNVGCVDLSDITYW